MGIRYCNGIIVKSIGGFYYVEAAAGAFAEEYGQGVPIECRARGTFREQGIKPVVGDRVKISIPENGYAMVEEIHERKNLLVRPPLANIDTLVIVASTCEPNPNTLVIDKMTAAAVSMGITPVIVISKCDLASPDKLMEIYGKTGIKTIAFSSADMRGLDEVRELLRGKITAFTGNSGVGKSTLLTSLFPQLALETGEISHKLGRGRHTTRCVELYKITDDCENALLAGEDNLPSRSGEPCGYVADTPGFSAMDFRRYKVIEPQELVYAFPEFEEYLGKCMFTSCAHLCEKGCAVLDAVNSGKISKSRHASYAAIYKELRQ